MMQYKYSAPLLNHDWQLLPGKSERFTGNLAVPSQDSRNPKPIVLEIKIFPFYLVILFKYFDQLIKKNQKVQTGWNQKPIVLEIETLHDNTRSPLSGDPP